MSKMRKTDMDQWKEIAQAVDDLQEARWNLFHAMNREGNVPKTVFRPQYSRLGDSTDQLKSDLEDRMFKEHPDDATTDVFYGGSDE